VTVPSVGAVYDRAYFVDSIKNSIAWYDRRVSSVVYISNVRLERKRGPLRIAQLPGEENPVTFSVHGAIAKHYGIDESQLPESHAATIDYVVAATAG
jgi:hypothetical protein